MQYVIYETTLTDDTGPVFETASTQLSQTTKHSLLRIGSCTVNEWIKLQAKSKPVDFTMGVRRWESEYYIRTPKDDFGMNIPAR